MERLGVLVVNVFIVTPKTSNLTNVLCPKIQNSTVSDIEQGNITVFSQVRSFVEKKNPTSSNCTIVDEQMEQQQAIQNAPEPEVPLMLESLPECKEENSFATYLFTWYLKYFPHFCLVERPHRDTCTSPGESVHKDMKYDFGVNSYHLCMFVPGILFWGESVPLIWQRELTQYYHLSIFSMIVITLVKINSRNAVEERTFRICLSSGHFSDMEGSRVVSFVVENCTVFYDLQKKKQHL